MGSMQSGIGMFAGVDEDGWGGGLMGDLDVNARGPVGILPPRDEEIDIFPSWDAPDNVCDRLETMMSKVSFSKLIVVV